MKMRTLPHSCRVRRFKFFTKDINNRVQWKIIDDKFAITKPCYDEVQTRSKESNRGNHQDILWYVSGELTEKLEDRCYGITDSRELSRFLIKARDCEDYDFVALDSETSTLYYRDGYMLGFL